MNRRKSSMIVLKVLDVKKFMAGFLAGTMLDGYQLASGSITTFCTFRIDGNFHKEFFENEETNAALKNDEAEIVRPSFVPWKSVKPFCFSVVRGKRTPLSFKFVFYVPEKQVPIFCQKTGVPFVADNPPGLCLNLKYDKTGLFVTTGISRKSFSLDRSADEAWDNYVNAYLKKVGIAAEKM